LITHGKPPGWNAAHHVRIRSIQHNARDRVDADTPMPPSNRMSESPAATASGVRARLKTSNNFFILISNERALLDAVFVVSVTARQEVIKDEIGDVAAEPVPARQVVAEMHARENATLRGFVRGRRKARERAFHAR